MITSPRSIRFRGRAPIKRFRPIAIPSIILDVGGIQIGERSVANQREGNRSGEQENLCQATKWAKYGHNCGNSGYAFEHHYKNLLPYANSI